MHDGEQSQDPAGTGPGQPDPQHGGHAPPPPGAHPGAYPPSAPGGFPQTPPAGRQVPPAGYGPPPPAGYAPPQHGVFAPGPGFGGAPGYGPQGAPAPQGFTETQWAAPAAPAADYGAYAAPAPAPTGGRRSRGVLIGGIVAALVAIAAVVVAVTGFWVPGYFTYTVLDTESVENGITEHLRTAGESVDVGSVACPGDIRVRVDDTFTCTLEIGGEPHTVTSTILDTDGTYRVGAPAAR